MQESLEGLNQLLTVEEKAFERLKVTQAAKRLSRSRQALLAHIRAVSTSGNLPLIIATEKSILQGDLERYANSRAMTGSLKIALTEIKAIERHLALVGDTEKYRLIDQGHSLPKKRQAGLPFDDARQALASHHARLDNLDKSRLDDEEKYLIDTRKTAIFNARQLYIARQTQALGVSA